MEQALEGGEVVRSVRRGRPPKVVEAPVVADEIIVLANGASQSLAMRIWNGQSPDVSVTDRVARIAAGLKEQGLPLDITLPHPDAARYLDAHK